MRTRSSPQPGQAKTAKSQALPTTPLQATTPVVVEQTTPATRPVTNEIAQPATGGRTHTVAKGETIAKIAEAAYGSQNYWPHIIRANPGLVAEKLRPGTRRGL